MLIAKSTLLDAPIMSLQTGGELGKIGDPIINPGTLQIVAYYVHGPRIEADPSIIHTSDIREISRIGLIVDDSDRIMSVEGLVRLKQTINLGFRLDNIKVIDENGYNYGRVSSYMIDTRDFRVTQMQVEPRGWRSVFGSGNLIGRSQIIEVTNKHIRVKTANIKSAEPARNNLAFRNPFSTSSGAEPEKA